MSLPGSSHNLVQHPNMCPVHAVKISHADQRRPEVSRNFIELMKNLHWTKPCSDSRPRLSKLKLDLELELNFTRYRADSLCVLCGFSQRSLRLKAFFKSRTPTSSRHTKASHSPADSHLSLHAASHDKCAKKKHAAVSAAPLSAESSQLSNVSGEACNAMRPETAHRVPEA